MMKQKRKHISKPKKTKFIVKESYSGTKKSQDIFADIFISEYGANSKKAWTMGQNIDIIEGNPQQVDTDNSPISVCSRKE